MKKALFVLIATVCLSLVSCFKESQYSITYHGDPAEVANVTIFEYDSSYDLVATRERRIIVPGKVYEITSSDLAHYLVIGVEATLHGHISEWYSKNVFELDPKSPLHIDISFTDMDIQSTNPVNASHSVQRYLHK